VTECEKQIELVRYRLNWSWRGGRKRNIGTL